MTKYPNNIKDIEYILKYYSIKYGVFDIRHSFTAVYLMCNPKVEIFATDYSLDAKYNATFLKYLSVALGTANIYA